MNNHISKISKLGILLLLGFSYSAQGRAPLDYIPVMETPAQETIQVRIKVLNEKTGNPLAGANISSNNKALGFTDENGVFRAGN